MWTLQQTQRRLSVRAVAAAYGIPARAVSRAISTGELLAVITTTETGRERAYIAAEDAANWFESLAQTREKVRA
jgi:hypothetical protein